jgi:hypothetical protein
MITGELTHPYRGSLMRGITDEEFKTAIDTAIKNGLHRGFEYW